MKRKLRTLLFGMSIHPGNIWYIVSCLAIPAALTQRSKIDTGDALLIGAIVDLVVLLPLYIWTSYGVGKINTDQMDDQ